jgi:phosphatidylglycerol---prolipoprotein diacylglyceryl transferase
MFTYPHIDPVALHLGPVQIHWYGIMYVVGFVAAWWLARREARRPGSTWRADDVDDVIFWAMLGVIVGGRIGYTLVYGFDLLRADPLYLFKIWKGGMSFHGALLGTIVSLMLFAWRRRRKPLDVLDFCAPLPGIGIFAGRMGNFINGELWGAPTDSRWGFLVADPDGGAPVVRHASQLYEAGLEGLCLFALVWWFSRKVRARGAVVGLGMAFYAVVRSIVELVRVPDTQIGYLMGDWLTMGQLLSAPMYLAGAVLLSLAWFRPQRSGNFSATR